MIRSPKPQSGLEDRLARKTAVSEVTAKRVAMVNFIYVFHINAENLPDSESLQLKYE